MEYPPPVKNILNLIAQNDISYEIRTFTEPAHRASDAAALLGCPLGAVIKSLVFQTEKTEKLIMVLVSGENRVDIKAMNNVVGKSVQPAKPRDVRHLTGFEVGSVPPLGIESEFPVIIDRELMAYELLWAAAGSANVLFSIKPIDLQRLSKGQVSKITAA